MFSIYRNTRKRYSYLVFNLSSSFLKDGTHPKFEHISKFLFNLQLNKVCGLFFGSFFMLRHFYRLELHNKPHVACISKTTMKQTERIGPPITK